MGILIPIQYAALLAGKEVEKVNELKGKIKANTGTISAVLSATSFIYYMIIFAGN